MINEFTTYIQAKNPIPTVVKISCHKSPTTATMTLSLVVHTQENQPA